MNFKEIEELVARVASMCAFTGLDWENASDVVLGEVKARHLFLRNLGWPAVREELKTARIMKQGASIGIRKSTGPS